MLMQLMLALLSRAWQTLDPEQMLGRGNLGGGVRSLLTSAGSRPTPVLLECLYEDRERKSVMVTVTVVGTKQVGGNWSGEEGK